MGQVVLDEFMWWEDTGKDNSLLCQGGGCFTEVGKSFLGAFYSRVNHFLLFGLYFGIFCIYSHVYFFKTSSLNPRKNICMLRKVTPPLPLPPACILLSYKYNRTLSLTCGRGVLRREDVEDSDMLPCFK